MKKSKLTVLTALLAVSTVFHGCATSGSTTAGNTATTAESNGKAEKKDSSEDNDRATKKISMAISEEVGDFTVTSQQPVEAPGGYNGTQYTVKTKAGKTYKCEIMEPSGFGKVMTWGMASGAGAMCTDFTKSSKDKGKTNKASCNALLQAAGKC